MDLTCNELKLKIARLKEYLCDAVTDDNLNSDRILEMSQELDQIINQYIKAEKTLHK